MLDNRLLDEFKTRLGNGVSGIISNTPEPTTEEGDLYYTRLLEVLSYLKQMDINVKV